MLIASVRGPSVQNAHSLQKKYAQGLVQLEGKASSSSLGYGGAGGLSLLTLPDCTRPDHRAPLSSPLHSKPFPSPNLLCGRQKKGSCLTSLSPPTQTESPGVLLPACIHLWDNPDSKAKPCTLLC